MDVSSFLWRI